MIGNEGAETSRRMDDGWRKRKREEEEKRNLRTHREYNSNPGGSSVNIERLEHLQQRPRRPGGRIAEDDHIEEVLPDAAKHARKCRPQQLKKTISIQTETRGTWP